MPPSVQKFSNIQIITVGETPWSHRGEAGWLPGPWVGSVEAIIDELERDTGMEGLTGRYWIREKDLWLEVKR